MISIKTVSGAWSEESHKSGCMEWLLSSLDPLWRNMRLMVEFELLSKSEYLVETLWVGDKSSKLKEFATIIRLSLKVEWWGKTRFQILFLILKSPAMIIKFDKFTSVFLRYFKVVWEESEYTFMIQKIVLLLKKEARRISMWLIMSFLNEKQREESLTLI